MRRRLKDTRVTIQANELPESAYSTGLNYRTRVTTPEKDNATTFRLVSIVTLLFIVVGFGLRLIAALPLIVSIPFFVVLIVGLVGTAYWRFITRRFALTHLGLALAAVGVSMLFGLVNYSPTTSQAYLLIFGTALLAAAVFAHYVTVQACAFMSVNERIRVKKVKRWQWYLSLLWENWKSPRRCPEITVYQASHLLLLVAFAIGYVVLLNFKRTTLASYAPMFGVVGFTVSLLLLWGILNELGDAPKSPFNATRKAAWKALTTFVCYNRHGVHAAGLFRFPTEALRPHLNRDVALGITLAILTTALVGVSVSSPQVLIDRYRQAPKTPEPTLGSQPKAEEFTLSPIEETFAAQLSPDDRARYVESKKVERQAAQSASWWNGVRQTATNFFVATATVLLLCWLGPFAVLFSVLWFTGGRLLYRYHAALEAADAYEVPPRRTKKQLEDGKRDITPWDNRIERMLLSDDPLEQEHYYLGSALEGDYPVLLHHELLHKHAHILGDTGSRKTSIGIAPLVAQLIAREDCSILIVDLKGDKTLFEAAREEADTVGMPFKWFTNITGRSSYVFNPLAQSHVPQMTTNQLTEGILHSLALDYGDDYGRGYFSTLNDLVLGGYLKRHRKHIGSFKELHRFVSDKNAFRGIGSADDWEKARHVARIVEKLADIGPMNVTAADMGLDAESPEVGSEALSEQIDLPSMLRKKQVVYFYLSTVQEQATTPKIAKLALFSLLTAASRRGKGEKHRVYVFIDEFQRVVSDNISLFLEQARSMRLHFILANQTIGQLEKTGVDLTDVVESCTAFKQSFRATDEKSIKRIMETSGEGVYHSLQWTQLLNDAFDDQDDDHLSIRAAMRQGVNGFTPAKVTETVGPLLEKNTIIEVSALPLASFVRFSEASGYTQFSGYPLAMLSEYHITKALHGYHEESDWPEVDSQTILVTPSEEPPFPSTLLESNAVIPKPQGIPAGFDDDLERRLNQASEKRQPPTKPREATSKDLPRNPPP